ncbi:MAG: prolyl oligopeptidase family serine peptidase [Pseudomonadota bacterium]
MPATRRTLAAVAAGVLLASASPDSAGASPTFSQKPAPMTFEEAMRTPAIGRAQFSPDGQRVIVSLEHHDRPSRGAPWKLASTDALVFEHLGAPGRPVGGAGQAFLPALCQPWSPNGRWIAGLVLQSDERRVAAWNVATGRMVVFAHAAATYCPTWIGERLVFPAPPRGHPDVGASAALSATHQLERWRAAWMEASAQVTVHSNNPDFPSPPAAEGRLVMADPETGVSTVIAQRDVSSLTPSPDGRWLAAIGNGPADAKALSRKSGRNGELLLFRTDGASLTPVSAPADLDIDYSGLSWSRDGSRLLVAGRDPIRDRRGLYMVTPGEPNASPLPIPADVRLDRGVNGSSATFRPIGWIDDRPAFIGAEAVGDANAAPIAGDGRAEYGEAQGFRFGLYLSDGAVVRRLTSFSAQSVTSFAANGRGHALVVVDGALWRISLDGRHHRLSQRQLDVVGLAELRPSFGLAAVMAVGSDRIAVRARGGDGGLRQVILDLRDGRALADVSATRVLATAPQLDRILLQDASGWARAAEVVGRDPGQVLSLEPDAARRPVGEVRRLDYDVGGRRLPGWIVLPPGYAGERLPTLVWIYGGAVYARAPTETLPGQGPTPLYSAQLWAARGYAVLYPSTPLKAGADADVPNDLAVAAVAAVDAAAAQGWTDPTRVGLIGQSFGGFSTAAVLAKRPDRFRAGVAVSGPYDFLSGWGSRDPIESLVDVDGYAFVVETRAFVEHGQIALRDPPYVRPTEYIRASPFFLAPQIKRPLLLMAGDLDLGSTSLAQTERMYAALRRSGSPAAMVRYWGQQHVQTDPGAIRDQWARATAWFDRYVRDLEVPSGDPAPKAASRPADPALASANSAPSLPTSPPSPGATRGPPT